MLKGTIKSIELIGLFHARSIEESELDYFSPCLYSTKLFPLSELQSLSPSSRLFRSPFYSDCSELWTTPFIDSVLGNALISRGLISFQLHVHTSPRAHTHTHTKQQTSPLNSKTLAHSKRMREGEKQFSDTLRPHVKAPH